MAANMGVAFGEKTNVMKMANKKMDNPGIKNSIPLYCFLILPVCYLSFILLNLIHQIDMSQHMLTTAVSFQSQLI